MRVIGILLGIVSFISLFSACSNSRQNNADDRILARVHNKSLYLSELDGMFPEKASKKDSSAIINAFVNRWVQEALLLHEAERNIPKNLNIDKLVRDYRASLIRNSYERLLIEELLDSTITKQELDAFYEKNKEQYQLETPIVRCQFIKIPLPVPQQADLQQYWNNANSDPESLTALINYCNQHATAYLLGDSTWYEVENVAEQLPEGTVTASNIGSKKDFTQRDQEFQYYLKVFDVKNRKDIAPLSYIEEQARKVILRRKQLKLLEEKMNTLYEVELRRNNIDVFTE